MAVERQSDLPVGEPVESKRQPRHSTEIIVGLFPTPPSRAN